MRVETLLLISWSLSFASPYGACIRVTHRFDSKLPDEPVKVVKKPKVILPVADKGTLDKESDKMKALAAKILKPPSDKSKKAPVNIDALEPPRDGYGRKKGRGHKRKAGK